MCVSDIIRERGEGITLRTRWQTQALSLGSRGERQERDQRDRFFGKPLKAGGVLEPILF